MWSKFPNLPQMPTRCQVGGEGKFKWFKIWSPQFMTLSSIENLWGFRFNHLKVPLANLQSALPSNLEKNQTSDLITSIYPSSITNRIKTFDRHCGDLAVYRKVTISLTTLLRKYFQTFVRTRDWRKEYTPLCSLYAPRCTCS